MKFEILTMLEQQLIVPYKEILLVYKNKYGIYSSEKSLKNMLLTEFPIVMFPLQSVTTFKTQTPQLMILLTQCPDNNWNVFIYKLVSYFNKLASDILEKKDDFRNKIAQRLHDLFLKYKFYSQHLITID